MANPEQIIYQPVFFLFVAASFLLAFGYFWGRRKNQAIAHRAMNDLLAIFRPREQQFTNIGGAIGYHANLYLKKKGGWLSRVDATITLLPRHSWLYLPVSKLIRKYDRLFLEMYLKNAPPDESHLIESGYSRFAGTRIRNREAFQREELTWGRFQFHLYTRSPETRSRFLDFTARHPDPGLIRHIAVVPEQKKCFVFMIPRLNQVAASLRPVVTWLPALLDRKP